MNKNLEFIIDIDRCLGCKACEVACKQESQIGPGFGPIKVIDIDSKEIDQKLHREFLPVLCMQCDDPECIKSCTVDALSKNSEGVITVDEAKCIHCGLCEKACSFGAIHVDKKNKHLIKCDLCHSRRAEGWQPSCVQHCPGRALELFEKNSTNTGTQKKYSWKTGVVVYVSDKWKSLGKDLS